MNIGFEQSDTERSSRFTLLTWIVSHTVSQKYLTKVHL